MGSGVLPQDRGAGGDALAIVQRAAGDALEIGLHRIEAVVLVRCEAAGAGISAREREAGRRCAQHGCHGSWNVVSHRKNDWMQGATELGRDAQRCVAQCEGGVGATPGEALVDDGPAGF
jgi:hypothetical protein